MNTSRGTRIRIPQVLDEINPSHRARSVNKSGYE